MSTSRILTAVAAAAMLACGPSTAQEAPKPTTKAEQLSYSIGADLGRSFQRQGIELDPAMLLRGLEDALAGRAPAMDEEAMRTAMAELQATLMNKQQEARHKQASATLEEGARFLAENRGKPGVTTLPSGLQYRVITSGSGASPADSDTVTVNYVGRLIDGTEFDSSLKRGKPATFPVNGVIPGWTEALKLMKVGDKWELYIPTNLAYGERGAGGAIPPNSALVFEVELLSVETK